VSDAGAEHVRGVEAAGHRAGVRTVALAPDDRTLLSLAGTAAKARVNGPRRAARAASPARWSCMTGSLRGPEDLHTSLRLGVLAPSAPHMAPAVSGLASLRGLGLGLR
jgi:hypothetical protein